MNYDFKSNWNDVILPLLSHPSIKVSIKKGINKLIKDGISYIKQYDSKKCPAEYSSNDGWFIYIEDYKEYLSNKLIETGFLKQAPILEEDEDANENQEYIEYENYKETILEPFIKHHEKTSLRAYQIFGACHWWNPTFSLSLAKLIYPNEKWKVISGEYHTTIVNDNKTLVFDILYFDENDDTKGGKHAIEEANKACK
jgi:hypothetical protein